MRWLWTRIKLLGAVIAWPFEPDVYVVPKQITYYSPRYEKWLRVPVNFECDHATSSPNIGNGPVLHDWAFRTGCWADGTPMLFRQANHVMVDYMRDVERQPRWVINLYRAGIKSRWSLAAWKEHRMRDNEHDRHACELCRQAHITVGRF